MPIQMRRYFVQTTEEKKSIKAWMFTIWGLWERSKNFRSYRMNIAHICNFFYTFFSYRGQIQTRSTTENKKYHMLVVLKVWSPGQQRQNHLGAFGLIWPHPRPTESRTHNLCFSKLCDGRGSSCLRTTVVCHLSVLHRPHHTLSSTLNRRAQPQTLRCLRMGSNAHENSKDRETTHSSV